MSGIPSEIDEMVLKEIILRVHRMTGITMTPAKRSLIQGRISKRMRVLNMTSYWDYVKYLDSTTSEKQPFINMMTTNETYFYRTPSIWEYFEKQFLPKFYRANPEQKLRIWSAAASSGEEAYSIAMMCKDYQLYQPRFQFEIFGSDISTAVLSVAEAGLYEGRSMDDLKERFPTRFARYFSPGQAPGTFQVKSELKTFVRFGVQSLFDQARAKGSYDIVFLRNVMIYFSDADLPKVLKNVSETIATGGTLIVGESESLSRFKCGFHFVHPLIYEKEAEAQAA